MPTGAIISEDDVREGYRMLYDIPHLAGADDPKHPWWPLDSDEEDALTKPTARMLARMPKARQEAVSRFVDPIALVMAAVIITQPRIEASIEYARIKRRMRDIGTTEDALRDRLSRTDGESDRVVEPANNGQDQARRTGSGRNDSITVQDVYSQE